MTIETMALYAMIGIAVLVGVPFVLMLGAKLASYGWHRGKRRENEDFFDNQKSNGRS